MALGFQDCCNSSSYFLLTGIPATVSEFEVYFIETLQGENFCAKYVELPKLNYSIPTYTLLTMTEYTDCSDCESDSHPCPSEQSIFLSQFGTGTIATSTDCYIKTIFPMVVECSVDPPTNENTTDGILGLYIIGGVPPYIAYEQGTHLTDTPIVYTVVPWNLPNTYKVRDNIGEGDYSLTVTDSQGNFFVDVTCTLDAPPLPATITCSSTAPNIAGAANGSSTITVSGGIPPYQIKNSNNVVIATLDADGQYTINNLAAGTYTYTVVETAQDSFPANQTTVTCTVLAGPTVTFPTNLCLSFDLCSQTGNDSKFYLKLINGGTYNLRPYYVLTTASATKVGLPSNNTFKIRWENDSDGWKAVAGTVNGTFQFIETCNLTPSSNVFNLNSTYNGSGTVPYNALPTNYTWSNVSNSRLAQLNATNITLSSSLCTVTAFVANTDSTICSTSPAGSDTATIVFSANGADGPFSFIVTKPNGATETVNNPIYNPTVAGNYTVVAQSSDGTSSSAVSFSITESCLTFNVTPNLYKICPDYTNPSGVVTFTMVATNGTAPYTYFWKKQGQSTYNTTNNTTVTVYGSANPSDSASNAGNNGSGVYEFYVTDSNGNSSSVDTVTLEPQNCTPVAPSFSQTGTATITQPTCDTNTGSISFVINGGTAPYTVVVTKDSQPYDTFTTNLTNVTINELPSGDYNITVSTSNGSPSSFNVQFAGNNNTINLPQEIAVCVWTHINEDVKNEYLQAGDYQTTTSGGRNTWNYPIDIEFNIFYPTSTGTLDGYFEVTLLTQRAFGPGIEGKGYAAINYADGWYLGMREWGPASSFVISNNELNQTIGTWLSYQNNQNQTWVMRYDDLTYSEPNLFPNNRIDGQTDVTNWTSTPQGIGQYTQYSSNVGKTCQSDRDRFSPLNVNNNWDPNGVGPENIATINTNFINFPTLQQSSFPGNYSDINTNCPTKNLRNLFTCYDFDLSATFYEIIYNPIPNNDYNTIMFDPTYNSNTNITNIFEGCDNPGSTEYITWTAAASPYILSLDGTLIVERKFEIGSSNSPITINDGSTVDPNVIRVNFNDYAIPGSTFSSNQQITNCDGFGLAFQIQLKFVPVTRPNCTSTTTPLPINYYNMSSSPINGKGNTSPSTEHIASTKMVGDQAYPTENFVYVPYINGVGYYRANECTSSSAGGGAGG